jgi:hypothetical protein
MVQDACSKAPTRQRNRAACPAFYLNGDQLEQLRGSDYCDVLNASASTSASLLLISCILFALFQLL